MTDKEAIKILQNHNCWRRDEIPLNQTIYTAKELGIAIDIVTSDLRSLEAENALLKKTLTGEDEGTIAYLDGVAEGRKHKDALVAAAYRAAANVASGLGYGGEIADKILSLTPADAEKALRDFGMEVSSGVNEMLKERLRLAFDKSSLEQIVDEVMKK